jgi:putative oxidoreductase
MRFLAFLTRLALGLGFVVFGLNGFLKFIPMPPPSGAAGSFMGAMASTHYLQAVCALEIVGGVLLLMNRVPLGLTLLGPVVVNIVLFHALMDRKALPAAAVFGGLSLFLLWRNKDAFPAIFPKSEPAKKPAKK